MNNIRTDTTLTDYCKKSKFARHPDNPLTEAEFNWMFKNRKTNGFSKAFIEVTSRNFLVDIPAFIQCLADRKGT